MLESKIGLQLGTTGASFQNALKMEFEAGKSVKIGLLKKLNRKRRIKKKDMKTLSF